MIVGLLKPWSQPSGLGIIFPGPIGKSANRSAIPFGFGLEANVLGERAELANRYRMDTHVERFRQGHLMLRSFPTILLPTRLIFRRPHHELARRDQRQFHAD